MATKKRKPGFDVPAAAPADAGWVYRSDTPKAPKTRTTQKKATVAAPRKVTAVTTARKATAAPASREADAVTIVNGFLPYAAGAGLLPVPILDVAAIGTVQYRMVRELASHYEVGFHGERARTFIAALAGSVLPTSIGTTLAYNVAYRLPGIGALIGALTIPALASASTYAVGKVFIQHFESGGTFLDFDPATVREYFQRVFASAKAR